MRPLQGASFQRVFKVVKPNVCHQMSDPEERAWERCFQQGADKGVRSLGATLFHKVTDHVEEDDTFALLPLLSWGPAISGIVMKVN